MASHIMNMTVETVPLKDLTPFPGNPRKGDTALIASSLTEHGQYRPLIVQRSSGHVLAGNNTLAAASSLGWKDIAVQYIDVDDERARKIVAVDNRSSDLATYDDGLLKEFLAELDEIGDLAGTGYTDDDLDSIIGSLENEYEEDTPERFVFEPRTTPQEDGDTAGETTPAPPAPRTETTPEPTPAPPEDDDAPAPQRPTPAPSAEPVAEMILAFTPEDRAEVGRLISSIREGFDDSLKNTDVILRALRTLAAAVDAKDSPDLNITVSALLLAAR